MPLPRVAARFNRVVTNRLFAPIAGRVPPWIVVEHVGRRSGRTYRTVVWGFPGPGHDLRIVLTYGPASDWVRNVLRAERCRVQWRGRWRTYAPQLVEGSAAARLMPLLLRPSLVLAGMRHVLYLHALADD
jgi:deazaflavin-dependent oxidoreductase (nitroreductase family)